MINIKDFLGLAYYTSELDQFLASFDKEHPALSASQRKEKEKYQHIYQLRDNPERPESEESFWDKF